MNSICVFCGSNLGKSPAYKEKATELGKLLVKRNIKLVYGGGNVGLMGAIADTVLAEGGQVIGVIPEFMQVKEVVHTGLTELIVVKSMHERKLKMSELADGFVTLPGGIGSMEEFFEVYTWRKLNLHKKPLGILNVGGYYDLLLQFLQKAVEESFLDEEGKSLILESDDTETLLTQMEILQAEKRFDKDKI